MTLKMYDENYTFCMNQLNASKSRYNALINVLKRKGNFDEEVFIYNLDLYNLYVVDNDDRVFYFNAYFEKNNEQNLDPYEIKEIYKQKITSYKIVDSKEIPVLYSGIRSNKSDLIISKEGNYKPKHIIYSFNNIEYHFYKIENNIDINLNLMKYYFDIDKSFFNFYNLLEQYIDKSGEFIVYKNGKIIGRISIYEGKLISFNFTKETTIKIEDGKLLKEECIVDNTTLNKLKRKAKVLMKKYEKED